MSHGIGIVGVGVVGSAMLRLFGHRAIAYDIGPNSVRNREAINACDVAFVCVPTPAKADGGCDISCVEEVVAWLASPLIVLRSTVPPGTTDRLRSRHDKRIVFQPEYLGETPAHPFADLANRDFIVLGGPIEDTTAAADLYKDVYNATLRFHFCDARTAELAKYMENAFFALKVTFVNEFYDIARACGVDFNLLREIWLADARIGRDHTFVYPNMRGFAGKCLPKDLSAIVQSALRQGYQPHLLQALLAINARFLELERKSGELHTGPSDQAASSLGTLRDAEASPDPGRQPR